ncbi:hypothetical protein DRQ05_05770, partial [bacterium]
GVERQPAVLTHHEGADGRPGVHVARRALQPACEPLLADVAQRGAGLDEVHVAGGAPHAVHPRADEQGAVLAGGLGPAAGAQGEQQVDSNTSAN